MLSFFQLYDSEFYISDKKASDSMRTFIILQYPSNILQSTQLFYQSSGHNTLIRGTWFPTNGLLVNWSGELVLDKLINTKFSQSLKHNHALINDLLMLGIYTRNNIWECLLSRFGTLTFLNASYRLGGGIWDNHQFRSIMERHFSILWVPYNPLYIDTTFIDCVSDIEINMFAKSAISTNYCKDEYAFPVNEFVDYSLWYKQPQCIGGKSPLNRTLVRLNAQPVVYNDYVFVCLLDSKQLMSMFLYNDLSQLNYEQFKQIKKLQLQKLLQNK